MAAKKSTTRKKMAPSLKVASPSTSIVTNPQQALPKPLPARRFLRPVLWILLMLFLLGLSATAIAGSIVFKRAYRATLAAQLPIADIQTLARTTQSTQIAWKNDQLLLLVLGTDGMQNRGNETQLTDTILLVLLDRRTGNVQLLSLPRDLWLPDLQTKINALYAYGSYKYPEKPQQYAQDVIERLVQHPIAYTIVVNMQTVQSMIEIVGGIEVNVREGFTDSQFPREDVDVTSTRDPKTLYKTVQFSTGSQQMDGQTALEYIRSRKAIGDQGTDNARSARQQEVLMAMLAKLQHPSFFWENPERAGELYKLFQQTFSNQISVPEVAKIGIDFLQTAPTLQLQQSGLPIYPADPQGVLEHPKNTQPFAGQWVYTIRQPETFAPYIQSVLGIRRSAP